MRRTPAAVLVSLVLLACQAEPATDTPEVTPAEEQASQPAPDTPEAKLQNALAAAPPAIAEGAAVMDWPATEGGEMTELRPGTNGWTCMPDVPSSPGNDPMCLDENFLSWAGAWQGRTTPEITGLGLAYMLQAGADASNTDPYATEPRPGEEWVRMGPHVMIVVPDVAMLDHITTDPESGGPFVMWKGTPYAHIMMPVEGAAN